MRVVAEQGLAVAWLATSLVRPERHGVFLCKATFALDGEELRLQPEGMGPMGDVDGGLAYPSDFVPFKPRADVVVRATARPKGGQPAKYLGVSMQVGALSKQLVVAGDRRWQRGLLGRSPGEPTPFTAMPITWSRALGGPGDAANTVGVGRVGDVLPNIELSGKLLQSPADRLPPAGFGPIHADWEPRRSQTGTYRGDYVQKHWPWFPPDFDYSYFNAAPRDQQVEGFLRGDEAMRFENLHRKHPVLSTRLPGLRSRLFVTVEGGEFREVPQRLDTVFCDLEEDRVILVWRGHTQVQTPMMHEVVHVLAALEPLAAPRDEAHYRRLRDTAPSRPAPAVPAAAAEDAERKAKLANFDKEVAEAEAKADALQLEQEQQLREMGVQQPPPQPEGPVDVPGTLALLQRARDQEWAQIPGLTKAPADGLAAAEVAELAAMIAAVDKAKQPPASAWTRDAVLEAVAAGRDLAGENLGGLDLSDCRLARAKLARVNLAASNLSGADLSGADLSGAVLVAAKLDRANLGNATLDGADLTGASLAGATVRAMSVRRTVLEGISFAGLDLSQCSGEDAQFAGADLQGCNCTKAVLPKANFVGCKMAGADFTGANLADARLHAADASRVRFTDAQLRGFRGDDGADFTGADFRRAQADGAVLEFATLRECDLRYATFRGALLTGSDFQGSDLSRADLTGASLADAKLAKVRLLQTNLLRASMDRCDLRNADLRWANLYAAGLWDAKLEGADLREAITAATLLALR